MSKLSQESLQKVFYKVFTFHFSPTSVTESPGVFLPPSICAALPCVFVHAIISAWNALLYKTNCYLKTQLRHCFFQRAFPPLYDCIPHVQWNYLLGSVFPIDFKHLSGRRHFSIILDPMAPHKCLLNWIKLLRTHHGSKVPLKNLEKKREDCPLPVKSVIPS